MSNIITPAMLDATRAEMLHEGKPLVDALTDFMPEEMECDLDYGLDSDCGIFSVKNGEDLDTIFVHVYFDIDEKESVIITTSGFCNYMWVVRAMEMFCKRFDIQVEVQLM